MTRHNCISHIGLDGGGVAERASCAGYPWQAIGENIAAGQMNAEMPVQSWVKSAGHCANLRSPVYAGMSAAFTVNDHSSSGICWVQVFGAAR